MFAHARTAISNKLPACGRAMLSALIAAILVAAALLAAPSDALAKTGKHAPADSARATATAPAEGREALALRAMPGKNNTGKANVVQLFGYAEGRLGFSAEDPITTESVSGYDVTGDGLADRFRAAITPQDSGDATIEAITDLRFYVNGLLALDLDGLSETDRSPFSPLFTVDLITLKNDQEFLLVNRKDVEGSNGASELYHYRNGSFEKVLSADGFAKESGIQEYALSAKPYGNNMDITYTGLGNFLKWSKITMSYVYDKQTGGLKLRGNDAKGVTYEYYTGVGARTNPRSYAYGKPVLTVVKPFKVFASASEDKAVFTAGKGARVIIVGATLSGDSLYFKVRAANGRTGYTNADKGLLSFAQYKATRWFEEVGI